MLKSFTLGLLTIPVLIFAPSTKAADMVYPGGGVLTQVADGGGTTTTITLVNVDSLPAPYSLTFYGDDGNPITFQTTAGPTSSPLTGTLNPNASVIITTNGGGSTTMQGYALLLTGLNSATGQYGATTTDASGNVHYAIAGSAVFSLALQANPIADAQVPLDTGFDTIFELPFDYTTAAMGVAIANADSANQMTVNVKAYDLSGTPIPLQTTSLTLPSLGHTAFMLTAKFPELNGKQGTIVFSGTPTSDNQSGYINVLGLRANLPGTSLSTVTPIVPCNYNTNSGCTN